jgi:hypothetical protein
VRTFFYSIALGVIAVWERLLAAWTRVGQVRAVYAVAGLYLATLALGLTLRDPGESWLWVVTLAAFALYCFARRHGGMSIFAIATMPGCTAFFAHELLGAPRWVGVALIPVALWMAWSDDQPAEQGSGKPPSVDAITSTT